MGSNFWWQQSCTSWVAVYPIVYRFYRVLIRPRWCRISSIYSTSPCRLSVSYLYFLNKNIDIGRAFGVHMANGRVRFLLWTILEADVHPGKLTCPLKRDYFNRKYIFQPSIFRVHVSFRECTILAVHPLSKKTSLEEAPLTLSPQTLVRFEPKKREDWENTFWDVQQKTNRLCYGL